MKDFKVTDGHETEVEGITKWFNEYFINHIADLVDVFYFTDELSGDQFEFESILN